MSKPWQKNKEKQQEGTWKDCGYLTISKSGKVLSVVVKEKRFVVNLEQATEVIYGQRNYTLIYEFVGEE